MYGGPIQIFKQRINCKFNIVLNNSNTFKLQIYVIKFITNNSLRINLTKKSKLKIKIYSTFNVLSR